MYASSRLSNLPPLPLHHSSSFSNGLYVARATASFPVYLSTDAVSFGFSVGLVSVGCANRLTVSSIVGRRFHALCGEDGRVLRRLGTVLDSQREYRKVRTPPVKNKVKELELSVNIGIEDDLPEYPEVLSIAELLRLNVPMAMKSAFHGVKDSNYKTRETAVQDLGGFESVGLSVLLCNDEFIRKLNKEWRDEDHATDVLSMSQHVPGLNIPILMLGDIVISVETAARQTEERGHTLLDEIRILMKGDPWNSIMAGAATGGFLSMRQGFSAASRSAIFGGVLLALTEGVGIMLDKVLNAPQTLCLS